MNEQREKQQMEQHREFYQTFCKPQFEDIGKKIGTVIDILKGANGEPGLCDNVRDLKHIHKVQKEKTMWLKRIFVGAVIVQIIIIIKEFVSHKVF